MRSSSRSPSILAPLVALVVVACGSPQAPPRVAASADPHAPSGRPCGADAPARASAPAPTAGEPSDDPPSTFDVAAIDAWIERQVNKRELVGLSVAIAHEGKIVHAKGYGRRSIQAAAPVGKETSFAIGSVTKQLTCAGLLVLADEKRLSLGDKVAKYLPDLQRAKDVTLDDLLSHIGGYPDYYPLDFVDDRMKAPTTAEQVAREYGKRPLDFEPRTRFSYSNTGFLVGGVVVQKVTGAPFGKLIAERIFRPLGMKHASLDAKDLTDVATGHTAFQMGDTEVAIPEAPGWLEAAGAAYASAEDLVRWDLGLVKHEVLTPKSYELMTTPRRLADGTPVPYACGLGVSQRAGETVLQHTGAVSGFLAYNAMIPRTRSAVVVLSNADHLDARPIHAEILGLLLRAHDARRVVSVAGPSPAQAARALFRQMQKGELDRSTLGAEFSAFMSDARVKAAAPRLAALGDPLAVEVEDIGERGGAQNVSLKLKFEKQVVRAILHRSADGKVQQFLLLK
ncbi:MAG: beta-lactamase family protein [Deltaproteobacteria bacterium]|nr:beta-lactamase family protein [Deltaproteobacteria bacterium]